MSLQGRRKEIGLLLLATACLATATASAQDEDHQRLTGLLDEGMRLAQSGACERATGNFEELVVGRRDQSMDSSISRLAAEIDKCRNSRTAAWSGNDPLRKPIPPTGQQSDPRQAYQEADRAMGSKDVAPVHANIAAQCPAAVPILHDALAVAIANREKDVADVVRLYKKIDEEGDGILGALTPPCNAIFPGSAAEVVLSNLEIARSRLSRYYLEGRGVPHDEASASHYLERMHAASKQRTDGLNAVARAEAEARQAKKAAADREAQKQSELEAAQRVADMVPDPKQLQVVAADYTFICTVSPDPHPQVITIDRSRRVFRYEWQTIYTGRACTRVYVDGATGPENVGPNAGFCGGLWAAGTTRVHQSVVLDSRKVVVKAVATDGTAGEMSLDLVTGLLRTMDGTLVECHKAQS